MKYESVRTIESKHAPGASFRIRRMSFGRRLELTQRLRELGQKLEYLNGGASVAERVNAALATSEIDRVYVLWGLEAITGLELDGEAATPESLFEKGPEELTREVVEAIKAECVLTEDERKN